MSNDSSTSQGSYSVRELTLKLSISQPAVLALIHSGQLRAINVAKDPTKRPRFRVMADDFDAFLSRRAHQAAPKKRAVKKNRLPLVKRYF